MPPVGGFGDIDEDRFNVLFSVEAYTRDRLDQDQRAMVNNIARCIHRRYFLSDKELRDLSDAEREQAKIHGTLSTFIRKAQSEAGLVTVKDSSSGRGSGWSGGA